MNGQWRVVASACAFACIAAGCGVPTDGSPSSVAGDDLPASLRSDAVSTTTVRSSAANETASIYLIRDGGLARVEAVAANSDVDAVLDLLQQAPTKAQARAGFRSVFTDADLIRGAALEGSTALIDLDPSFLDAPHQDQILALGQLVLTATARPGTNAIQFTIEGEKAEVPASDGTLIADLLRRADYESLLVP